MGDRKEEGVKPVERRGVSSATVGRVRGRLIEGIYSKQCTNVPQQRLTAALALATLVSAFGSSFQYGYNVAVVNAPAPVTQALTLVLYGT